MLTVFEVKSPHLFFKVTVIRLQLPALSESLQDLVLDLGLSEMLIDRLENASVSALYHSLTNCFPLLCATVLPALHQLLLIFVRLRLRILSLFGEQDSPSPCYCALCLLSVHLLVQDLLKYL